MVAAAPTQLTGAGQITGSSPSICLFSAGVATAVQPPPGNSCADWMLRSGELTQPGARTSARRGARLQPRPERCRDAVVGVGPGFIVAPAVPGLRWDPPGSTFIAWRAPITACWKFDVLIAAPAVTRAAGLQGVPWNRCRASRFAIMAIALSLLGTTCRNGVCSSARDAALSPPTMSGVRPQPR